MAKALAALVKFYQDGPDADREAYDIAWVQDKASPVEYDQWIRGLSRRARHQRRLGRLVFYVNREKTTKSKLAQNAQWFEDHNAGEPEVPRKQACRDTANAIDVVIETGDSGR